MIEMALKKVLIIEDEVKLARLVELELKYEGYEVTVCYDGKTGFDAFKSGEFDIILLDLMLPEINGMEVCRRVREISDIPIIMLTAKDELSDKISGLDNGADDYMTKPFAIEELLARMRAIFKRQSRTAVRKNILEALDISIDLDKRMVKVDGNVVELTKKEYELLVYMIKNKNVVLTREQILNEVWGYSYIGETNVVDVYIRYLRSKIDDVFGKKYIHTIRGVGYFVKEDEEEE